MQQNLSTFHFSHGHAFGSPGLTAEWADNVSRLILSQHQPDGLAMGTRLWPEPNYDPATFRVPLQIFLAGVLCMEAMPWTPSAATKEVLLAMYQWGCHYDGPEVTHLVTLQERVNEAADETPRSRHLGHAMQALKLARWGFTLAVGIYNELPAYERYGWKYGDLLQTYIEGRYAWLVFQDKLARGELHYESDGTVVPNRAYVLKKGFFAPKPLDAVTAHEQARQELQELVLGLLLQPSLAAVAAYQGTTAA